MTRKDTVNSYLPLIALVLFVFGEWLMGMFGKGISIGSQVYGGHEKSDSSWYLGLSIFISALVGLFIFQRVRNKQPMDTGEMVRWEIVRATGKRRYIYEHLIKGVYEFLYMGLLTIIFGLFIGPLSNVPLLLGTYAVLFLSNSIVMAIRQWDLNERAYRALLESAPQHNNSFNPTAR